MSLSNNIVALNPTGLIDYNNTITPLGPNTIVVDPSTAAKDNLTKSTNNEVICSSIETFKNYDKNINKEIILIIIFLVILLILYFI